MYLYLLKFGSTIQKYRNIPAFNFRIFECRFWNLDFACPYDCQTGRQAGILGYDQIADQT